MAYVRTDLRRARPAGGRQAAVSVCARHPAVRPCTGMSTAATTVPSRPLTGAATERKGFYSERGIDPTLVGAQGGAAIVPGVVSGQFQFGFSYVTSLMITADKNVPVKAVASGVASTGKDGGDFAGIVVRGNSPLKTAEDLEGKKVAVNTLDHLPWCGSR